MNKLKSDRIRELLPRLIATSPDPNWQGLIDAIGEQDDRLTQLIEDVRNQFFVKTASRPYIDRLAANNNITRPRFVGMSDSDFRTYIPILSYQPKQVKKIIEQLLDLFFLKEATTAFLSTSAYEPFVLETGWKLQLMVDGVNTESITFTTADFSSITAITADELAATYNRQSKYSYATSYYDSVTKKTYIRIFSNTIGTQGSIEILGGLANIGLQLNGFLSDLGTGTNTQWNITKVGDEVTITYTGGTVPGIDSLLVGDIFLCNLPGNQGTFVITDISLEDSNFKYINLLATAGSITQTSATQTKFLRPEKFTAYKAARRALLWETTIGQATVEMPATPSIVRRNLKGGFFINGSTSTVTQFDSSSSLTVADASDFPPAGIFLLEPVNGITARLTGGLSEDVVTYNFNGRLISTLVKYTYTGITTNTLTGITPSLPAITGLNEYTLSSLTKSADVVTAVVSNTLEVGDHVFIQNSSGIPILSTSGTTTSASPLLTSIADLTGVAPGQIVTGTGIPVGTRVVAVTLPTTVLMTEEATASAVVGLSFNEDTNGGFEVQTASSTSFTYNQLGTDGSAVTPGRASIEKLALAEQDSKVIVTTARSAEDTGIIGPYVWDPNAAFVLSADSATVTDEILAGRIVKLLAVSTNSIPDEQGYLIFDYGLNTQEGPVKYLYKATSDIIALDPSYTFQQNHEAGCSVIAVSHKGPHTLDGAGSEYSAYVTDPSDARLILEDLITSVASAGIFIDFIIRYPVQLYGTLTVYS